MKGIIKMLTMIVLFITVIMSGVKVDAKDTSDKRIIDRGVTEEGIVYIVYDTTEDNTASRPNIVVSKHYKDVVVQYRGIVTPPNTFNTSVTEAGITYSGTLYLTSYLAEKAFGIPVTNAYYSGVLYARI